ncbi:hypothetical protein [Bradyrhizobium sp.]|jgi:hypothetical protein|uniref:hypothetical protein n=1 Tax=Bradyrhizobium sp. TaxID=376 RepID=UPI002E048D20|nr:hypothetical protein [Bradyrhizobium sp.]
MDEALNHFSQVSIFGRSATLFILVLVANLAITAIHSWQEWNPKQLPQWRYLGAIAGTRVPDILGFLSFTAGLTLLLWACGIVGIAGRLPFAGPAGSGWAAFCLGAVIGGRLSDTWVSHWKLHYQGYDPNPGLFSTPLYILEAVFMIVAFHGGLGADPVRAWIGIAVGAGFFVVVAPGLKKLRDWIPAWREAPWKAGDPIPDWTARPRTI